MGRGLRLERQRLPDALAYLPGPATRVQFDDAGEWRGWPDVDQRRAAAHVVAGGRSTPPPPLPEAVEGAWPHTPLTRAS
ncbi:MAG: hypothetical protein WEB03_00135 [Nitriliruptor sp.]|uniref:hypothetical protein n=1 Tax=Nitriliruptor sp. TaxID=2448056 RepID=UPI0034A04CED